MINISTSLFNSTHSFDSSNNSVESNIKEKVNKLRILTLNFQGIWSKKESVEKLVNDYAIDIIIGSETHLNASIKNNEITPEGYISYRCDRKDGWGGVTIIC